MVVTRRNQTRARCVPFVPTNCEEIECEDGMVCEMRERLKDGKVVPRCKLEDPGASRVEDCSQLTCREGLACQVLPSGMAKCVMTPPPMDCKELDCGEGMECKEVGIQGRVKCVQLANPVRDAGEMPTSGASLSTPRRPFVERGCRELDCEAGFQCRMTANRAKNGDRRLRPTCVPMQCSERRRSRPPQRCMEVECGRGEECVECREGEQTRARCQRRPDEDGDRGTDGERERPTRRPDSGTNQVTTDRVGEEREKPTGSKEEKPTGNEEREKPTGFDEDEKDKYEEEDEKALDEDEKALDEDEKTLDDEKRENVEKTDEGKGNEEDEASSSTDMGEPDESRRRRRPPVMCEELECGEHEMCFEFEHEERSLARCVSAGWSHPSLHSRPTLPSCPLPPSLPPVPSLPYYITLSTQIPL